MELRISQSGQAASQEKCPFIPTYWLSYFNKCSLLNSLVYQQPPAGARVLLHFSTPGTEKASGHNGCQIGPMLLIKDSINMRERIRKEYCTYHEELSHLLNRLSYHIKGDIFMSNDNLTSVSCILPIPFILIRSNIFKNHILSNHICTEQFLLFCK